jgi:hypothetical protein
MSIDKDIGKNMNKNFPDKRLGKWNAIAEYAQILGAIILGISFFLWILGVFDSFLAAVVTVSVSIGLFKLFTS